MPFNLLAIGIILISFSALIYLVLRKFPALSMVDVSTIAKEREIEMKEKIIQARLERYVTNIFQSLAPSLKNLSIKFQNTFQSLYKKILSLEKKYQRRKFAAEIGIETQTESSPQSTVLHEAAELMDEGSLKEAEEKYIEVLTTASKNLEAYHGLVRVYFAMKDYEKARETALYLLKLEEDDAIKAEVHFLLGEMYREEGFFERAIDHAQKAITLAGNNPRYLDFLLDLSIMVEDKSLALEVFEKFHLTNPDNTKLAEYKARIEKLIVKKLMEEKQEDSRK